jgi:hypothetical protein
LKSDLEVQQMQQTNAEELAHRIAMNEEELQSVRQKLAIAQQHARQAA